MADANTSRSGWMVGGLIAGCLTLAAVGMIYLIWTQEQEKAKTGFTKDWVSLKQTSMTVSGSGNIVVQNIDFRHCLPKKTPEGQGLFLCYVCDLDSSAKICYQSSPKPLTCETKNRQAISEWQTGAEGLFSLCKITSSMP